MGGSSKSQTVGYKYYLGMHQALCHGPVDKLVRIRVDKRCAWVGYVANGRVNVSAESLFGGESREGGVSGAIDFETGASTQGQNDYLASKISADVPNFRGVCAAVLRQVYVGMNPYLKAWDWRVQRIHTRQDGIAQWYDEKAEISGGGIAECGHTSAIYIALDGSGSMTDSIMANGKTRLESAKIAIAGVLDDISAHVVATGQIVDLMLVIWGGKVDNFDYRVSIMRRGVTPGDINDIKAFLSAYSDVQGTYFPSAVIDAPGFFAGVSGLATKLSIFVTDGEPSIPDQPSAGTPEAIAAATSAGATLLGITNIEAYAFNIDLLETTQTAKLDNTTYDAVPVLDGNDPDAMGLAISNIVTGHNDMNPAHIIRECLTDPNWGMGYPEADMDDAAFMAAADTLWAEQMGISILWDRQIPLEDFIKEILKHIDAVLYVDRTTGKFVLKLIRDDYDAETLLVLNEDNCERVDSFKTPALGELVNSITIHYWDSATGNDASLTVHDTALAQLQGGVVNTTVEYPGFTNGAIAARIAARDLKSLSTPIVTCTIYANREASGLNVGGVFKLQWPEYGIGEMVMRVTAMAYGDGKNNRIRIQATQDVFSLPEAFVAEPPSTGWVNPVTMPAPSPNRLVIEAPYYEVVQQMGQAEADAELASNPERGYLMVAGDRPSTDAIHAVALVNAGAGYAEAGVMDFAPSATLSAAVGAADTTLPITAGVDLDLIVVGSHAQVGSELVRVDAVGTSSLTVGRGCLDTVPAPHTAGTVILAWDHYAFTDQVEYADGETLNAKLLTVTGLGQLAESFAPADGVTLDQRALRPYPPGQFRVNGSYYPETIGSGEALSISWAHRDRVQQTAGELMDHTAASIGPEAGTTYTVRLYGESDALLRTELALSGSGYEYLTSNELADSALSGAGDPLAVFVSSLVHADGANGSTTITDDLGVVWTASGQAQLRTDRAAAGAAALFVDSPVDTNVMYGATKVVCHFDGSDGGTTFKNSVNFVAQPVTGYGSAQIDTAQAKFGGSSALFNGSTDYLLTASVLHLNSTFCVEAWVRPAGSGEGAIIAQYKNALGRFTLIVNASGKLEAFIGASPTNLLITSANGLNVGAWNHVAVSRDASNVVRLFHDGVLVASGTSSQGIADTNISIGGQHSADYGLQRPFNGHIDDVRITTGAARYTANFTPPTRPHPSMDAGDFADSEVSSAFGFGTGDFTVEMVVQMDAVPSATNAAFFDIMDSTGTLRRIALFYNVEHSRFVAASHGVSDITGAGDAPVSDQWMHLALVRASGVLTFYLDGVAQWSGALTSDLGSTGKMRLGHSFGSQSAAQGTWIDEVRVTKTARYTTNFTPPPTPYSMADSIYRLNGRLRVELESVRDGLASYQHHDHTVYRPGYGFNYGMFYGGV